MKIKDLILDRLEISKNKFCKEIKISRQTLDNIINETNGYSRKSGEYTPSLVTIKKICKYFNVDFHNFI